MEEDGERAQLLQRILDLLLTGGYFRSRISALPVFDKLTGGLAWSIISSNVDVDFDIHYDDEATLGYKIKVGEAIEEALQRMGCPHPLQAHQIQGLDYQAVLPVVQWLMKRVSATREEFNEQSRRYSLLKFQQNYQLPEDDLDQQARLGRLAAASQVSLQQRVHRLHRRSKDNSSLVYSYDRLQYTLLEYGYPVTRFDWSSLGDEQTGHSISSLSTIPLPTLQCIIAPNDAHVAASPHLVTSLPGILDGSISSSNVGQISELGAEEPSSTHQQQAVTLEKQIKEQEGHIARLQQEANTANESIKELSQKIRGQDDCKTEILTAFHKLEAEVDAADAADAGATVKELGALLEKLKTLESQEAEFRVDCRRRRAEMQAHIKLLQDSISSVEDDEHSAEIENAFNTDLQKWKRTRMDLSRKNRAVAVLQRRLDEMPAQTELMQYERRFMELYLHIQRKLRETRKYFATYNALAEANELTLKEISLLNSIHSQFEVAMMTPDGRARFVQSMDAIAKGVQQKLDKIQRRFEIEQSKYNSLKEKHSASVAAHRHYYALVKIFQEECAHSENLQAALEHAS